MNPERIPTILAAMLLSIIVGMITGPLAGNANPFMWNMFAAMFGSIGDRLDRKKRTRTDLMMRGFIVCIFALVLAFLIGRLMQSIPVLYPLYGASEVILLSLVITSGAVWFALLRLYFAMEQDKMGEGAYFAIAQTARRNLSISDNFGITRTAMGLAARSFDKGLVAPVLWFIIGGFPLAMVYCTLAALSWRFGKDGFNTGFAGVIMALEKLMGFIPCIFAGLLITLAAAFTPTAKLHVALKNWIAQSKKRSPYEQGGAPLSALAWALNISLGGASQDLSGSAIKSVWVGPEGATAQINHKHLRRGIYINAIAHLLFVAALLGAYMWGGILK